MSQIDREMEQIGRGSRSVTLFSTVGAIATPLRGRPAPRPSAEPWLARVQRGVSAGLEQAIDALLTWRERASMRRQLLALDDRLLKDIGITRLQAQGEAEKPFWKV